MTTAAPRQESSATDERTRMAWTVYRDTLRDLSGEEYEAAEHEAWDALQRELHSIASNSTRRTAVG